jgi:hypothetical protein
MGMGKKSCSAQLGQRKKRRKKNLMIEFFTLFLAFQRGSTHNILSFMLQFSSLASAGLNMESDFVAFLKRLKCQVLSSSLHHFFGLQIDFFYDHPIQSVVMKSIRK